MNSEKEVKENALSEGKKYLKKLLDLLYLQGFVFMGFIY